MKNYIIRTDQYFNALKALKANGMELDLINAGTLWCEALLTEQQVGALRHNGISVQER
jgi:hypothetical protein